MMTGISVNLAKEYLSDITIHEIDITKHFLKRCKQRKIDHKWISDCLINSKPIKIVKKDNNKFLLSYKHPKNLDGNLIIVIAINMNTKHITIITTYEKIQNEDD